MKELRYLDDVSSLVLDKDKCIGCSLCTEVCPHSVFEMQQQKAHIVDFNACMECGTIGHTDAILVKPGVG